MSKNFSKEWTAASASCLRSCLQLADAGGAAAAVIACYYGDLKPQVLSSLKQLFKGNRYCTCQQAAL
jgi:hypothetical protein